jgi:hypothetical protein
VEKCVTCQFYDRRNSTAEGKGPMWGQCRRTAPMLHPVNVKSYMIEGVWPHVRDDDWCGEWKVVPRRVDARPADARPAMLVAATPQGAPRVPISPLPGPLPSGTAIGGSLLAHGGRGGDD